MPNTKTHYMRHGYKGVLIKILLCSTTSYYYFIQYLIRKIFIRDRRNITVIRRCVSLEYEKCLNLTGEYTIG